MIGDSRLRKHSSAMVLAISPPRPVHRDVGEREIMRGKREDGKSDDYFVVVDDDHHHNDDFWCR